MIWLVVETSEEGKETKRMRRTRLCETNGEVCLCVARKEALKLKG